MKRFTGTMFALGLALVSAAPALAQNNTSASVTVATRDLNLSTEAGARQLLTRIHIAAASVCFDADRLYASTDYIPCIAAATRASVARLGNPFVSALNDHNAQKVMVVASVR